MVSHTQPSCSTRANVASCAWLQLARPGSQQAMDREEFVACGLGTPALNFLLFQMP